MTTFPHGGRVSPHEHLGGGQDQPFSSRQRRPGGEVNEVIDLSTTSSPQHSCPTATTAFALFAGAKLSDFTIGDRLGATRDGGEGFQGCNSRVFRATLRRQSQHNCNLPDNTAAERDFSQEARPASPQAAASSRAAKGDHNNGTPARQRSSVVGDIMDLGEQVWKGSFGACFSGNYGGAVGADEEARRESPRSVKPREGRGDTEWALKMVLTYAGQDPLQAARDMETEISVLVGTRISPHANIMRGVHSFQDDIGRDLQPVLWDGLGPEAGQTLSSRTFFVVMPLFTAGSLQALLNKRRLRCKGPPFLRLLETMQFVEQMLSAVSHLLAHGIAHNDIKPDNWLLRADQRTLVLTDFGAAVDSLRPERQACSSSPARISQIGATAATAGTGPGKGTFAAGAASGETGKRAVADNEMFPAPTTARCRCQPPEKRVLSASESLGLTGKASSGVEVDEDVGTASPARKRRRNAGDEESGGQNDQHGRDKPHVSSTRLSDRLLVPFSKYCVAGTPSIVAPELARAWREEKDLDFRRSDVFSVGVCMYRMLRPDTVYIDNGTGLEGKGALEKIEGRFGQHAWPLPLFPENKGGCPYEVAQLCRGLLQPDPVQRQGASEGQSIVSWFVSRLEAADRRDAKGSAAGATSQSSSRNTGPPVANCGEGDARMQPGSPRGGEEARCSSVGKRGREGSAIKPVDMTTPPLLSGVAQEICFRDNMVLSGDAKTDRSEGGTYSERAGFCLDTAVRGARSEEERRLEEPDELVRSDRISHMRDFFASAAPEDLFRALDSKGWDVAAACAVFDDVKTGEGGGRSFGMPAGDLKRTCAPREPEERASTPGPRFKLWFDSVAEELQGRHREAFATLRRPSFHGSHGQRPSSRFGT